MLYSEDFFGWEQFRVLPKMYCLNLLYDLLDKRYWRNDPETAPLNFEGPSAEKNWSS